MGGNIYPCLLEFGRVAEGENSHRRVAPAVSLAYTPTFFYFSRGRTKPPTTSGLVQYLRPSARAVIYVFASGDTFTHNTSPPGQQGIESTRLDTEQR